MVVSIFVVSEKSSAAMRQKTAVTRREWMEVVLTAGWLPKEEYQIELIVRDNLSTL